LAAAFLYDMAFHAKDRFTSMDKLAIALPLVLSVFVLFSMEEINSFLKAKIEVKHALAAFVVFLVIALMFLRSVIMMRGFYLLNQR